MKFPRTQMPESRFSVVKLANDRLVYTAKSLTKKQVSANQTDLVTARYIGQGYGRAACFWNLRDRVGNVPTVARVDVFAIKVDLAYAAPGTAIVVGKALG